MKLKYLFFSLIVLFICSRSFGQGENNIWSFGFHKGLDFNEGFPKKIQTSIRTYEGCATICDKKGNLLFYSNGQFVWNRKHILMPNGAGLLGNYPADNDSNLIVGSATQGVAITPFINDPNKYFLFVLDAEENEREGKVRYLRYSIIDLSKDDGLGDVDTKFKNVIIDSFVSEQMAFAKGDKCNLWLVVHLLEEPTFHSFKITEDGKILPPVKSVSGLGCLEAPYKCYSTGEMKISSDSKKLALVSFLDNLDYVSKLELHDFNMYTGIVSNYVAVDTTIDSTEAYGIAFSPDNTKLYADFTGIYKSLNILVQYDLSLLPDLGLMRSKKYIRSFKYPSMFLGGMRTSPTGQIYIANVYLNDSFGAMTRVATIENPNEKDSLCNVVEKGILFENDTSIYNFFNIGFGTEVLSLKDTIDYHYFITSCKTQLLKATPGFSNYLWNDGDIAMDKEVIPPAEVSVYIKDDGCKGSREYFHVRQPEMSIDLGNDTFTCLPPILMLNSDYVGKQYLWQDGSTGSNFLVNDFGKYWVTVSEDYCHNSDTINIGKKDFTISLGPDVNNMCSSDTLELKPNPAIEDRKYLWQDGTTNTNLIIRQCGKYYVEVKDGIDCIASDTILISNSQCLSCVLVPNAFTPNNDGKNDKIKPLLFCPTLKYNFKVFNRWGAEVFSTYDPNEYWDGTFQSKQEEVGVYFYLLTVIFNSIDNQPQIYKGDITLLR